MQRRRRKAAKQLELPRTGGWGGKRRGAGRKRAVGARSRVAHVQRPAHKARHPIHITLRARSGLPSFRQQVIHRLFVRILRRQRMRRYKDEFRVVHFSVQRDHLHLVVEADSERAQSLGYGAIRSGISGLEIAFARRLNKLLGRKGKVWADRYHRRDLKTPKEMAIAYAYIFGNYTHHGEWSYGEGVLDVHSSAWVFDGWAMPRQHVLKRYRWRWPVCRAHTWLASKGYLRHAGPLPIRPVHP